MSPNNDFIYSADDMGNAVWAHSYDSATGEVAEVQYLAAASGSNPRHLTVHPNGNWVYVVYEEANSIASYKRDTTTGELTFTNTTYSLLPSGVYSEPIQVPERNWVLTIIPRIHKHILLLGRRSPLLHPQQQRQCHRTQIPHRRHAVPHHRHPWIRLRLLS